jgi:hypothetical protein
MNTCKRHRLPPDIISHESFRVVKSLMCISRQRGGSNQLFRLSGLWVPGITVVAGKVRLLNGAGRLRESNRSKLFPSRF